jgi:hypothetical protein
VEEEKVLVWAPDLPGYGVSPLLRQRSQGLRLGPAHPAGAGGQSISNGLVSAGVDEKGRVWLKSEAANRTTGVTFERQADFGDLYTPSLRGPAVFAETTGSTRVVARGPLRSALLVKLKFSTQVESSGDSFFVTAGQGGRDVPAAERSSRSAAGALSLEISVDADSHLVQLTVHGNNQLQNNRLRLVISVDMQDATVAADGPLGVVMRPATPTVRQESGEELVLPTEPLHRQITILNSAGAATIFSDGCGEYQYEKNGRVSVTMVRATGELSRHDLPERPGNAGWPTPTPLAQELGGFTCRFGWMAQSGNSWSSVAHVVEKAADDFLHPIRGITLRSATNTVEATAGVELLGDGLALSAIKESEDGRFLVLRCVNLTNRAVSGRWRMAGPLRSAYLARLDERSLRRTPVVRGSDVPFRAPAKAVVTMLVR